jgi:tetratricopeptide (TPR) repeat protein
LPAGGEPTTVTPELAEQVIPMPGFLASAPERRFREGVVAYIRQDWDSAVNLFEQTVAADTRNVSDDYFLGASYTRLKKYADAAHCLERVVASDVSLPDPLMQKYVPGTLEMQLPITDRITVSVGFDSIGATLVLAELYQELGRQEEAIGLVQRLLEVMPDDDAVRLSLADLMYDDDDFKGLVELTQGVENRDDVTLAILHLRAKALANEALIAPAAELLSACLRRTAGRDAELLKEIRYNRAEAYELLGEAKKAKADWSKLVAEDAFYRDARERLAGSSG